MTPAGDLVAVPSRGTLMGNRGVLHDATGIIVRRAAVRRWITCRLEFRGRHRVLMTPGRYTELFFLDEATSLAAGHRPCAECRREEYDEFRRHWATAAGLPQPLRADNLDRVLATERALTGGRRTTLPVRAADLPDGAFVLLDDDPWLVRSGDLLRWTSAGYTVRRPAGTGRLPAQTPPSTLAVLGAGYRAALHPTAAG